VNTLPMTRVWIGLGSNLDDPLAQLHRAVAALAALPGTSLACVSAVWRNPAMPLPEASETQPDYFNAVAGLDTALAPLELLDALQAIETAQGRKRIVRWGPRTLDLDVLLFGQQTISTPRLVVPHPGMTDRRFVLQPLFDLAPALHLPDGRPLSELLAHCPATPLELAGKLS
jgi:2-amino-4-hydroxy-6-hydroxymethyldihydropteridine diphosphokinase